MPNRQINSSINGTAVYDGGAKGAQILGQTDATLGASSQKTDGNYSIKSKILIVFTDGEDNSSVVTALDAIKVAKEFGIKIYSIAFHGEEVQRDIFGTFLRSGAKGYDDTFLKMMAERTGGRFYQATDPDSLLRIYDEINQLEKTDISKQVSMEYSPAHRPWILAGLVLLLLSTLLSNTVFRVLP
ncbi:MAG: VWA domain-containing protein [Planctomycetes bacterium]|nr:VWA domain-containing protein [Planctomycetota bacterium]